MSFHLSNRILLAAALHAATSQAALCDAVIGLNCWGNDIENGGTTASAAECCAKCSGLAGCNAWTWDANEGTPPGGCWLKTSCAGQRNDSGAVSGFVAAPAPQPVPADYHNGVSMGGWLLTEPSWMFDQFSAPAEADLIAQLRASGGDAFAVATMRNHWAGYIPDEAYDTLAAFGTTHVRIPVGYWITEEPLSTIVPDPRGGAYNSGFNHEGFITGGLAFLEAALEKLKKRNLRALVDVHAMPGGASSCQSYAGWQVDEPNFWRNTPPPDNSTEVPTKCGGSGPYFSSRGDKQTWMAVGEDAVLALGRWVASLEANSSLSGVVVGLEVVNEPGLGFNGVQGDIERLLVSTVPPLQQILAGTSVNVTLNFIGPNDVAAGAWVATQINSGLFDASRILIDFHEYFNWDGPETWAQLADKICGMTRFDSAWSQYTQAGLPVVIGEWSCSTNLGAKAFTDLTDPTVRSKLGVLFANQLSLYSAHGGDAPNAVGQHHWALRMGSGWDPRPSTDAPQGRQVPGSAWNQALPQFNDAVWGLGELIRLGIARPLRQLNVTGVCSCTNCNTSGG